MEEKKKLENAIAYCTKDSSTGLKIYDRKYNELMPLAGWHFQSLFPNNYLPFIYENPEKIIDQYNTFKELIEEKNTSERQILNYINNTEAFFILESLLHYYDFGHHDAYLFKEFPLYPQYVCDYLLVGKNSGGYEFIFIEFEHPYNEIILKDGELGHAFRKGIIQLNNWEQWLESNYYSLKNIFNKYKSENSDLPSEFYELDMSRMHYMVVAGRRHNFNSKTYRIKRKNRKNVMLIHYDNLLDTCKFLLNYRLNLNYL